MVIENNVFREAPYALIISVPDVPPLNTASDLTWKQKRNYRKKWEKIIFGYSYNQRPTSTLRHAIVSITRHTSGRAPDYDNLVQSAKVVVDPLIKCGIIHDDNPETIGRLVVKWRKSKTGYKHTTVYVRECRKDELDLGPWDWEVE